MKSLFDSIWKYFTFSKIFFRIFEHDLAALFYLQHGVLYICQESKKISKKMLLSLNIAIIYYIQYILYIVIYSYIVYSHILYKVILFTIWPKSPIWLFLAETYVHWHMYIEYIPTNPSDSTLIRRFDPSLTYRDL